MSEALRVEGISVRLGTREVLRDIDLTLRRGEMVGLLGRNGAGKSTLLRVVTRVLEPDAGRIWVDGRPQGRLNRRALARAVALVPQETTIPFPFRVGEVVLMGRAPHLGWLGFEGPGDVRVARAAMEALGIETLVDRPIRELSGGERQLVVVARALAQDPEILLLDEPTAFLDLRHRVDVLDVVRARTDAGGSALVVSHDLALAARYCDRLALLAQGQLLAVGAPRDVLTSETLRRGFGVDATVVAGPEGEPLVVTRRSSGSKRDGRASPPVPNGDGSAKQG